MHALRFQRNLHTGLRNIIFRDLQERICEIFVKIEKDIKFKKKNIDFGGNASIARVAMKNLKLRLRCFFHSLLCAANHFISVRAVYSYIVVDALVAHVQQRLHRSQVSLERITSIEEKAFLHNAPSICPRRLCPLAVSQ